MTNLLLVRTGFLFLQQNGVCMEWSYQLKHINLEKLFSTWGIISINPKRVIPVFLGKKKNLNHIVYYKMKVQWQKTSLEWMERKRGHRQKDNHHDMTHVESEWQINKSWVEVLLGTWGPCEVNLQESSIGNLRGEPLLAAPAPAKTRLVGKQRWEIWRAGGPDRRRMDLCVLPARTSVTVCPILKKKRPIPRDWSGEARETRHTELRTVT